MSRKTTCVVVLLAAMAAASALGSSGCSCSGPSASTEGTAVDMETAIPFEELDLDEDSEAAYYYKNSDVYAVQDASGSPSALNEADAISSFSGRGFDEEEVTTEISDGGELTDETDASVDSDDIHPVYVSYYETESGNWWAIYAIDGDFMASPISYNLESGGPEVIVSENGYITSYDIDTDRFYRLRPTDGSCEIVTVDHIDPETLEALSAGELGVSR